jgi:hypothetical protein
MKQHTIVCGLLLAALTFAAGARAQFSQRTNAITALANGDVRGTFATWTAPNAQTISLPIDLYGVTTHIVTWVAGPGAGGAFDVRILASRDGQKFDIIARSASGSGKAVFRGVYRAIGIQVPVLAPGSLDASYYGTNNPQPEVPQLCTQNGQSWDAGILQLSTSATCSCSGGQVTACLFNNQ